MKKWLSAIVILGILVTAVIGFSTMHDMADHTKPNCIASVIDSTICPEGLVSYAIHHISAYQSFSKAPLIPFLSSLLALAVFAYVLQRLHQFERQHFSLELVYERRSFLDPPTPRQSSTITRWLSLFEHSPSY